MRRLALGLLAVVATGLTGCPEWLEVDDGEEVPAEVPMGTPLVLPTALATAAGEGPYVPRTPGLRVPLAGYWTRARLDTLDALFNYTWVSVDQGEDRLFLRLEAVHGQSDAGYQVGPSLKVVVPIALPPGTDASVLKDGFVLRGDALTGAVVGFRTSSSDLWQVELTRLELTTVRPNLIVGTLEGLARRGAQGQRGRSFAASFVALDARGAIPPMAQVPTAPTATPPRGPRPSAP